VLSSQAKPTLVPVGTEVAVVIAQQGGDISLAGTG